MNNKVKELINRIDNDKIQCPKCTRWFNIINRRKIFGARSVCWICFKKMNDRYCVRF